MKDYYKILGIESNTSGDDVKKAYRKLAFLYHPDINKNEDAKIIFQEINEAYSILSDAEKRKNYDDSLNQIQFVYEPVKQRTNKPQARQFSARYYREKAKHERYITLFVEISRIVSIVILIFSVSIFVDYILPSDTLKQTVLANFVSYRPGFGTYLKTECCRIAFETNGDDEFLAQNTPIKVRLTPFYKIVKDFEFEYKHETVSMPPQFGIYKSYFFFPLITLFLSIDVIFIERRKQSIINVAMSNAILFLMTLFILLIV